MDNNFGKKTGRTEKLFKFPRFSFDIDNGIAACLIWLIKRFGFFPLKVFLYLYFKPRILRLEFSYFRLKIDNFFLKRKYKRLGLNSL